MAVGAALGITGAHLPRNPASHTAMFSAQALPGVRARVLGDGDTPGLLERMHTAPPPRIEDVSG